MVPATNTIDLPYQFIENTYDWYQFEIWISISIILFFIVYLLYRGWQKYEVPSESLRVQSSSEDIEDLIKIMKMTEDGKEFCRVTRCIFELKYGFTLIPGRSILSQKVPQEARNILMLVEGYEYATIRSGNDILEQIRSKVLTHFG